MPDGNFLERPPRIQPELPETVITIPQPPQEQDDQQPLWQAAVPIITILGYVLVSASGSGASVAFIIPMALTVFISTGIVVYNTIKKWDIRRQRRAAYRERLVEMRREMVGYHNRQRTFYQYNYPDPAVVLEMRGDSHDNRSGSRLWERRTSDHDFGAIRLGIGTLPSTVIYKIAQSAQSAEMDDLLQDAERLESASRYVADVPITIPLYQPAERPASRQAADQDEAETERAKAKPNARHALGIAGALDDVYEYVYSLIVHFSAFHSPTDTMISVLGMHDAADRWAWAYDLPHCSILPSKGQYRLYFEDGERIFAGVSGTLEALHTQPGKVVMPGQVVAEIRTRGGALIPVYSKGAGRAQFAFAARDDDKTLRPIDVGMQVTKNTLLMRLDQFDLTVQQLDEELDPTKNIQHRFGKQRNQREIAGVPRFWKENIWAELDRRARRLRERDENNEVDVTLPFHLIVVDLLAAAPEPHLDDPLKRSWLDDLESEAAISLLMTQGAPLGAAIIVLTPTRSKIPSGCQSVIELKRDTNHALKFLYAETGLNTPKYVGVGDTIANPDTADQVNAAHVQRFNRRLSEFSRKLAEWEVRRSYGADIPRAVGLLSLYDNAATLRDLNIERRWYESQDPKRIEWPKIPLGMLAGQETRSLHFFADADGVHGMIAGSTGSGKSELLMTMILSLAVKYDPSMVNFVLIDFKGGAAFDPFRHLPHVVDMVTNLRGNAVARMFAAINAELNRRQQINQDNDVKDIVRYRKSGLHLSQRDNYPHLFIIIDEFAEMIANNPEYKAQLDSITRLGRALGVSLILAAQRPTGVTDQMRANIKFRICLRVETREESSELLRLPDASYLPSIPGRGYLQVGSDSLELIQVGYTGESYTREDYSNNERYETRPIIWEDELGKEEAEPMYDVMVRRMAKLAAEKYTPSERAHIWRRPWPSPLPEYLSLDQPNGIEVEYLRDEDQDFLRAEMVDGQPFTLVPAVWQWFNGRGDWEKLDWQNRALRVVVGLIDDPANARLQALTVNLSGSHYAIFGASGWGKSVFLQSVIAGLVATHSPDDLHLYLMDFGNRRLEVFTDLPHTGAFIVSHEKERIERLIRMLDGTIESRKEMLSRANVSTLVDYNVLASAKRPADLPDKLPALLVVIDNFAEFKDTYDMQMDTMVSLVRDGLAVGVHFLITGEQSSALGKLFNLIGEKIALKLSDDGEYPTIVGRGARPVDEIPGRGLRRIERSPLELQVALPVGFIDEEVYKSEADRLLEYVSFFKKFNRVTADESPTPESQRYSHPPQIDVLETWSVLPKLLKERAAVMFPPAYAIIGRADEDLTPLQVALDHKPHFIITGAPSSGKTTALQTFLLSLASSYSPQDVALVLIDYQGGIADYGGECRIDDLPHVLDHQTVTEPEQLEGVIANLRNEFFEVKDRPFREVFVFIDNYDDLDELTNAVPDAARRLGDLARRSGKQGLHFVLCGQRDSFTAADEFLRPIAANRFGLALDVETAESQPFYASVPRIYSQMQLPRGRGFVLVPGRVSLVQVAVPYPDPAGKVEAMDATIKQIIDLWNDVTPAEWLPMVESAETTKATNGKTGQPTALTPQDRARVIAKIAQAQNPSLDLNSEAGRTTIQFVTESLRALSDQDLITMATTAYHVSLTED